MPDEFYTAVREILFLALATVAALLLAGGVALAGAPEASPLPPPTSKVELPPLSGDEIEEARERGSLIHCQHLGMWVPSGWCILRVETRMAGRE